MPKCVENDCETPADQFANRHVDLGVHCGNEGEWRGLASLGKLTKPLKSLVPKAGLEPARPQRRGILNSVDIQQKQRIGKKYSQKQAKNIQRNWESAKICRRSRFMDSKFP